MLVTDVDADHLRATASSLRAAGHVVRDVASAAAALDELSRGEFDVVVAAVGVAEDGRSLDGETLCAHVVGNRPDVPVVLVMRPSSLDRAVAAVRAGAFDLLPHPVAPPALLSAVQRAAGRRALLHQIHRVRAEGAPSSTAMIGESAPMRRVRELVARIAPSEASVLINGASGTGKEVVARMLHDGSRRSSGPFVSINCAALPEHLLESELFGHTRGAFTDARQAHGGLFHQARGGTFFLDEIGDMPLALQPKLLRALQERTIRPVGSSTEVDIDVRIVAATNVKLEDRVSQKHFRADLYFRLAVVQIALPPLAERGDDVLLLAHDILARLAARDGAPVRHLTPAAAELLLGYAWPGNVRELQNCLESAVALGAHDALGPADLPERLRESAAELSFDGASQPPLLTLEEVESQYIAHVLARVGGNKTAAARVLGLDRKTLHRKLEARGVPSESNESKGK